jgi:hypothetical protein
MGERMTANFFDSDWDYYESRLTPEQRLAHAILDGEVDTENFWEWVWSQHKDTLIELVIELVSELEGSSIYSYALEYSTDYLKEEL